MPERMAERCSVTGRCVKKKVHIADMLVLFISSAQSYQLPKTPREDASGTRYTPTSYP